jgi:hypothetical protein
MLIISRRRRFEAVEQTGIETSLDAAPDPRPVILSLPKIRRIELSRRTLHCPGHA